MRLVGLDALRGVAAILVVGFHVWAIYDVWPVFNRAYIAVDFFFMLSGYVLARTYEGRMEPVKFAISRFRRLAPTMAIGAFIGFLAFASIGHTAPAIFLWSLIFIPTFVDGMPFVLNRPAWSIFFEYLANVAHAVVFARLNTLTLAAIAAVCAIILASQGTELDLMGARDKYFLLGFPRVALPYLMGIILWRTLGDKPRGPFALAVMLLVAGMAPDLPWFTDLVFVLVLSPLIIICGLGGQRGKMLGDLSFPLYAVHYPILQLAHWNGYHPAWGVAASLTTATAIARWSHIKIRFKDMLDRPRLGHT